MTNTRVNNTFNEFLMLANDQFIENVRYFHFAGSFSAHLPRFQRIYSQSEELEAKPVEAEAEAPTDTAKTHEQLENVLLPRYTTAIRSAVDVLQRAFLVKPEEKPSPPDAEDGTETSLLPVFFELTTCTQAKRMPRSPLRPKRLPTWRPRTCTRTARSPT